MLCWQGLSSESYGFVSSHVRMWELDNKKRLSAKDWCFQTMVLEKTLDSPLDWKIISVNPKENQPWIFTERTDAEAPVLWQLDAKSQLIGKDPDARKGKRKRGWQRMRWLGNLTGSMNVNLSKFQEIVEDRGVWHAAVHGVAKSWTWLSNCRTWRYLFWANSWKLQALWQFTQKLFALANGSSKPWSCFSVFPNLNGSVEKPIWDKEKPFHSPLTS